MYACSGLMTLTSCSFLRFPGALHHSIPPFHLNTQTIPSFLHFFTNFAFRFPPGDAINITKLMPLRNTLT
jgi:hypothetical protein